MKSLKKLNKDADIAWVKYANAWQTSQASEENLLETLELKRLFEVAEDAFQLQKKQLDNKTKV